MQPRTSGSDDITTSIEQMQQATDIAITKEGTTIKATAASPITSIIIYNSNAAMVAKSNSDRISTGNLADGIYIIKVRARDGEKNFKFINK